MKPLASQKQLLVAESDLNRAQLAADIDALKENLRVVGERAESYGMIASSMAALVAGIAAFKNATPGDAPPKRSWPRALLKGAGMVSNIWLALRSQTRGRGGPTLFKTDKPRQ